MAYRADIISASPSARLIKDGMLVNEFRMRKKDGSLMDLLRSVLVVTIGRKKRHPQHQGGHLGPEKIRKSVTGK